MNIIFENWAIEQGWNIVKLENSCSEVPEYYSRYNNIPEEWLNFIRGFCSQTHFRGNRPLMCRKTIGIRNFDLFELERRKA